MFKRLICSIFGHRFKYDFPVRSYPTKSMCSCCMAKWVIDVKTQKWIPVESFEGLNMSDVELLKRIRF